MNKRERGFPAIGEGEYNQIQALAKALVELGPKLKAMTSVVVDSQEDLEHQGVEHHPVALKAEAEEIIHRTQEILARYERQQAVGWDEYQTLLVDLKTLILKIDPENQSLKA